jgi:hypothetical protein
VTAAAASITSPSVIVFLPIVRLPTRIDGMSQSRTKETSAWSWQHPHHVGFHDTMVVREAPI